MILDWLDVLWVWFLTHIGIKFFFGGLFSIVAGIFGLMLLDVKAKGDGLQRHMAALPNPNFGWADTYDKTARNLLNWLDGLFGKVELGQKTATPFFRKGSLTSQGLDRALLIAFVYPLLLIMLVWVITGDNTSNIDGFLPEDTDTWRRYLAFLMLACSVLFARLAVRPASGTGWRANLYWLLAVAVAVAVAGAVAGAFAFAVTGAFAGAVAVAVAGAGAGAKGRIKPHLFWPVYFAYVALLLVAVNIFDDVPQESYQIAFFFVLLPAVNALFDWVSIGITRQLLWQSLAKSPRWPKWLYFLFDFGLAFVCLVFLIISLVLAIEGLNYINFAYGSGTGYYDLAALMQALRSDQGGFFGPYFWVYAMILSTFMPTIIHFMIWLGAITTSFIMPKILVQSGISLRANYSPTDHWGMAKLAAILTLHKFLWIVGGLLALIIFVSVLLWVPYVGSVLFWFADSLMK